MSMAVHENEERNTTASPINDQQPPVVQGRCPCSNPQVPIYTVKCIICKKWREVDTLERYEEIRERILQRPFVCEEGREWNPDMSCHQPDDIGQDDESKNWAIDWPNIPRPPPGWKRILSFRREPGPKLADVYYFTPTERRLRSLNEVQKHLNDNPHYGKAGVKITQFSFQIPKENHARERSGGAHADGIAEPGETSGANPSPSGDETREAKKRRVSSKKAQE